MDACKLEAMRAELARRAFAEIDEALIEKALSLFDSTERNPRSERIPGLPYTDEERRTSIERAVEQHRMGVGGMSHEELKKEMASW
ncbi:MAG: hypothetical protein LBH06_06525 [Rikenellaceae bacterium]|nr:hypothetical protein [Rikenellaceae bacterium]